MATTTRPLLPGTLGVYDSDGYLIGIHPASDRSNRLASFNAAGTGLLTPDGGIAALSEVVTEVAATASAGATVLSGAGLYAGYRCTVAAGNITIYDGTSASGKVLVPTTALAVGSFPIYGAGTNHRLAVTTGVHVVLSGAATVYVGVE